MTGRKGRRRRWWAVALVAVAGLVVGAAIGVRSHSVYSSTATMSAGPITGLSPAQVANASSNLTMAGDYAQLITTDAVARRVAQRLHTTVGYVSSHLSAAVEAGTALFDITGTGPSASSAQALTATAASSLREYIGTGLSTQRAQPQLLSEYQQAERDTQSLKAKIAQLQAGTSATADSVQLQRAQAKLSVAELRAQGLASLFMEGDQTTSVSQDAQPTILAAPSAGTSTAKKKTVEYAIVGLLAGLCLGVGLILLPRNAPLPPGATPRRTDNVRLGQV
jgi:capsular polysaccharide biosynthesis protein